MAKTILLQEQDGNWMFPLTSNLTETMLDQDDNIDDINTYLAGNNLIQFNAILNPSGSQPFGDGHLISFIWRNRQSAGTNYIHQIALEDDISVIKSRCLVNQTWSAWKTVSLT